MKNFKATEISELNRNCYAVQNEDGSWKFTAHYGDKDIVEDNLNCLGVLKEATLFFEAISGTEYFWNDEAHYGDKDIENNNVSCFCVFRDALDFFNDCMSEQT